MSSKASLNEETNGIGRAKRRGHGVEGGYKEEQVPVRVLWGMEPRGWNRVEALPLSPRPQAKSSRSVDRASTWDAPQATCTIS